MRILSLLIIISICKFGYSQSIEYYNTANSSDDLCGNTINSIYFDQDGNAYFSTEDGLSIYDGENWKSYAENNGVIDYHVNCSFVDRDNNLWVGTDKGVSVLGKNEIKAYSVLYGRAPGSYFSVFQPMFQSSKKDFIPDIPDTAYSHYSSRTDEHVFYFMDDVIIKIDQDAEGNIWIGTEKGGISRKTGNKWTSFNYLNNFRAYECNDFDFRGDDEVWVATEDGIRVIKNENIDTLLTDTLCYNVFVDVDNAVWVTYLSGVARFHKGSVNHFNLTEVFDAQKVKPNGLTSTTDGTLFLLTHKGLLKFKNNEWVVIDDKGFFESIRHETLASDNQGNIWIGGENGLLKYDGNSFELILKQTGLASNVVSDLSFDNNGDLWAATNKGVSVFNGNNWLLYNENDGLVSNMTTKIETTDDEKIWVTTENGTSVIRNGFISSYRVDTSFSNDPEFIMDQPEDFVPSYSWRDKRTIRLIDNMVYDLDIDSLGQVWFATGGGVSRFDGVNWKSYDFDPVNGLFHCPVENIKIADNGRIWMGSYCGAWYFENGEWKYVLSDKSEPIDSIPITKILQITFDDDGNTWFAGGEQIVKQKEDGTWLGLFKIFFKQHDSEDLRINFTRMPYRVSYRAIENDFFQYTFNFYEDSAPLLVINDTSLFASNAILYDNYWHLIEAGELKHFSEILTINPKRPKFARIMYYTIDGFDDIILPGTEINDIEIDADGNVWYATNYGITKHEINWDAININDMISFNSNKKDGYIYVDNNHLYLSENIDARANIEVFDLQGRLLLRNHANLNHLADVSMFKSGMYIVKIEEERLVRKYKFFKR